MNQNNYQEIFFSLPILTAELCRTTISNCGKQAIIYGNLAKDKQRTEADYHCVAFFIKVDESYRITQTFSEALDYILHLKSENSYKEDEF